MTRHTFRFEGRGPGAPSKDRQPPHLNVCSCGRHFTPQTGTGSPPHGDAAGCDDNRLPRHTEPAGGCSWVLPGTGAKTPGVACEGQHLRNGTRVHTFKSHVCTSECHLPVKMIAVTERPVAGQTGLGAVCPHISPHNSPTSVPAGGWPSCPAQIHSAVCSQSPCGLLHFVLVCFFNADPIQSLSA